MKSLVILLLFSCGSLIAATNIDFFANGRSNIFAPLNERTRSIIYTGYSKFADDLMNETSNLSWPEKYRILSEINHSNHDIDENYYPDINMEKISISIFRYAWNDDVQEFIDMITDREILFKLGLKYLKEAQETSIDAVNRIKYKKYYEEIRPLIFHDELAYFIKNTIFSKYDIIYHNHVAPLKDSFLANECRVLQSVQQMFANYWGHVNVALVHEYFITYFLNEFSKVMYGTDTGQWETYLNFDAKVFRVRSRQSSFFELMRNTIGQARLEVKKCNSVKYIEDVTYTRLDAAQGNNLQGETLFSLEPVFSNFDNNSVITGARFVKKNNVIYIQIQEGYLLPNGFVDNVHWVPIKETKIKEKREKSSYDLRSIDLTDVMIPNSPEQVLIGVGFNRSYLDEYMHFNFNVEKSIQERISLKIYSIPLDFTTGKLITQNKGSTKHPWVATGSSHPSEDLIPITFTNLREPISSTKDNIPDSKNNQYLIFKRTNSEKNDEIIVPYIDIQPVETMPSPLSGIGLYHKGNNETSGFLALKLHTFNIKPFLKF